LSKASSGSPADTPLELTDHDTLVTDTGGDGTPLVLVHAFGLDRRMWRDVIRRLPQDQRVIAYDLRGHGYAAGAPKPFSLQLFADDLVELLDVLRIPVAHVAGLSLGGSIAQRFALNAPDCLASLALISTTATPSLAYVERAEAAEAHGMEAQVVPSLDRWFTDAALAEDGWGVRYARERVRAARRADWAASWRALAEIDTLEQLGSISAPTHVIVGEHDSATPADAMREIAARIPNSTFDVVAGGRHMLSLDSADALAALLAHRLELEADPAQTR
jgi:3-oxoadipate enol-lactonase